MEVLLKIAKILALITLLTKITYIETLPTSTDETSIQSEPTPLSHSTTIEESLNKATEVSPSLAQSGTKPHEEADLGTSESEQKEHKVAETAESVEPSDNEAAASNFDPSIYGGLITPDAFQQYVNQFGAAFPYAAPYPAPVYTGYVPPPPPPVYPSPYVVQTGYEGYLVPATTDATTTTTTTSSTGSSTTASPTTVLMSPFAVLSSILSTLMMSTLFKIFAGIVSTVGMVFFGGAIMNFICNYTPLCDLSFRAVTYMRRRENAEHMGRMIAEGMTPERVKRAAEFVQNAIRIYQELQKSMATN